MQGLVPAAFCLIPHTFLIFIFIEQLKQNFGEVIVNSRITNILYVQSVITTHTN